MSSLYSLLPFSSMCKFRVSGFPSCFFCTASAFTVDCFLCSLCFCLSILLFLACWAPPTGVPVSVFTCRLLRRFFVTRCCPIFAIAFVFFVLVCLSPLVPLPFLSVFLAYPSFVFSARVSLPAAFLFSSSPFGSFALASGLRCFPCGSFASVGFLFFSVPRSRLQCFVSCFLPSGSVCNLVTYFIFLSGFLPGLCFVIFLSKKYIT